MTDLLLEWMSFRGAGRTDDVPAELADGAAARRIVDDFAMLGHLELVNGAAWRIAPPVLAGLPGGRTKPGRRPMRRPHARRAGRPVRRLPERRARRWRSPRCRAGRRWSA